MTDIILCGVGGQGTVLASKMIAAAAMEKGLGVMSAETIGMAQKGGSVFSHLRVGDGMHTPMIAKGTAEAVRMLPFLKDGGKMVVNSRAVKPVTSVLKGSGYDGKEMIEYLKRNVKDLTMIDCDVACREIGSPKVTNMVLLGAAVRSGALDFDMDDIKTVLRKMVRPQFAEANEKALDYSN